MCICGGLEVVAGAAVVAAVAERCRRRKKQLVREMDRVKAEAAVDRLVRKRVEAAAKPPCECMDCAVAGEETH